MPVKDASEALKEQQRPRVFHLRRETEARVRDSEGETWQGLDQAIRRLLSLLEAPNRSPGLSERSCLLQGMYLRVLALTEERHSEVNPSFSFSFSLSSYKLVNLNQVFFFFSQFTI